MIINKEILSKLNTIAVKMENVGFGDVSSLKKELVERYLDKEVSKLNI